MNSEYKPILIGHEDKKKIFIEYGEYLKIIKFAKAGASDGSRGVLLGRRDSDCIYITAVLEALYSGGEGIESPSFSPDSWGRIEAEIKENFSDRVILGQYATHSSVAPNRMDYIMQDKYFGKQNTLLFAFDPTDNEEKMYIYTDGEFQFLNGFFIYDKFGKQINLSLREAVVRPLSREYEIRIRIFDDIKKKIKRQNNFYAIISIVMMVLIIYNIVHSAEIEYRMGSDTFPDRENVEWKSELKSSEN